MASFAATRICTQARPARPALRVRAEETGVAKVDRSSESLFFPTDQSLSYLDGTHPADFGFDPLGLSDPEGAGGFITPEWLRYGEIINGRWAMLGAAGCVAPELLGGLGVIPPETNILWYKTGVFPPAGTTEIYGINSYALFWIEAWLMNIAELRRWQDYQNPGSMGKQSFLGLEAILGGSGEPAYPGGPFFNFAGLATEGEEQKTMRTKEIKNGRLAMLAMLGFAAQACMTGKGPVANLVDHISDPLNNNIIANLSHVFGQ